MMSRAPGHILSRWAFQEHSRSLLNRPPIAAASTFFLRSRSLNIFKIQNKEAMAKERQKILEEMNRGYFDDVKDMNKHKGKIIATCNELNPPEASVSFPKLMVYTAGEGTSILPPGKSQSAPATLICLSFRASCQKMADSWIFPLREAFPTNDKVHIYEISWVESGILSFFPVRKLLLKLIQVSKASEKADRKIVYSFGDSYDARKALSIANRLAGNMYLVDAEGRVRWRATGVATSDEASSLISCTSALVEEQASSAL